MSRPTRIEFKHNGNTVYEWEQNLTDGKAFASALVTLYLNLSVLVLIFVKPPNNVKAKELDITITMNHLRVGIKGAKSFFLDGDLYDTVVEDDSFWTLDDGIIGRFFIPVFSVSTAVLSVKKKSICRK
jgi:hypothetical protein